MAAERITQILSDCIVSPLGFTSEDNFSDVLKGSSKLEKHTGTFGLPESFVASLFDRERVGEVCAERGISDNFTFFEKCMLLSSAQAIERSGIDASSDRVIFIFSTTKGNIGLLGTDDESRVALHSSAKAVAGYFGNKNTPLVVSNACISGVCALIAADRTLASGRYDYAVVTGADCQSRFIVSGFQSFKALSDEPCRPFDAERKGLNLGEASATIVLGSVSASDAGNSWYIADGAIRNDANHISGPSRTGEGSFRTLRYLLESASPEELAFINVHGTSTPYNDEMESFAIERAGLSDIPVNALKGYYGHTMGAAGILESIISMRAADAGTVIGTKGYNKCGVNHSVNISASSRKTDKKAFIKLLSGFGGCNAGLLFRKGGQR